jgi:hypothetical protein
MPPEQLAQVDIAEMNLLCATGLPGAEKLDIDRCLARLDEWAAGVRRETERYLHKFRENPGDYNNSEGYFRMLMLITVLQQDFGVHYNVERIRNVDFTKSKDLFIHGMINDANGGTCVSMPVIYTAVARRLGYPVRLVLAKAHVFCRWDAPSERFNIEATSQGMNAFADDYYKTWPEKLSDAEVKANRYLVSLSPAEELASFLGNRGHCLLDTGRCGEALSAYSMAHRLAPLDIAYLNWMRQAEARLRPPSYANAEPRGLPEPRIRQYIEDVEAINAQNRRMMEERTRPPASSPPGVPPQPYRTPMPGHPPR